jgi:hypothetical protein
MLGYVYISKCVGAPGFPKVISFEWLLVDGCGYG